MWARPIPAAVYRGSRWKRNSDVRPPTRPIEQFVAVSPGIGRHLLQIPGPSNVPDEVLRAMSAPTIDHRGPDFAELAADVNNRIKPVFGTAGPIVTFPSSGTGAWEAALVNTLSPGDRILCFETGYFATLWQRMAMKLGLMVDFVPGDWRHGVSPDAVSQHLAADSERSIKAVLIVHNETSSGVLTSLPEVRAAMDESDHQALLLVDAVSSLAMVDYRHDEWGIDVTVASSQKGLMLPPGLGFNAVSEKALAASTVASLPKSYWDWKPILEANERGFWPYTPPTNMLFGLSAALGLLEAEGLKAVFDRHRRHAEATRLAVRTWGLDVVPLDERECSPVLTAVFVPENNDADRVRAIVLDRFNMSLGTGLGKLSGRVFRIGHLGQFNDLSLAGVLAGVQMGLTLAGIVIDPSGVTAALDRLQRG